MARYMIETRRTNDPTQADGYGFWDEVGEWEAEDADTAIDEWLDEQRWHDDRFARVGDASFRLDDAEYDVMAKEE